MSATYTDFAASGSRRRPRLWNWASPPATRSGPAIGPVALPPPDRRDVDRRRRVGDLACGTVEEAEAEAVLAGLELRHRRRSTGPLAQLLPSWASVWPPAFGKSSGLARRRAACRPRRRRVAAAAGDDGAARGQRAIEAAARHGCSVGAALGAARSAAPWHARATRRTHHRRVERHRPRDRAGARRGRLRRSRSPHGGRTSSRRRRRSSRRRGHRRLEAVPANMADEDDIKALVARPPGALRPARRAGEQRRRRASAARSRTPRPRSSTCSST